MEVCYITFVYTGYLGLQLGSGAPISLVNPDAREVEPDWESDSDAPDLKAEPKRPFPHR